MRIRVRSCAFCLVVICFIVCISGVAQNTPQPLITQRVDESQLVTLKGNTHPLAESLTDLGVASSDLVMHRMLLLLNHSSAQDAALTKLLDEQQEKDSPNYHHWLTPNEFGQQFGASLQDIQTVTTWLQSQGFQVAQVSRGQNVIEFSGTAGQVQKAFHTAIHSYLAKDGAHWANASDPQIPAALAPVIAGVESLNNFPRKASNEFSGIYSANEHRMLSKPQFTQGCGTDNQGNPITCFAVSPYDFATIYNVLPLWNAGIDGTGETIAVVGRSNINTQDVSTFRSLFNLPPADANHLQIILNGPDPGIQPDESEADIDVQWSGAVAKNAKIDFVVSESTESTDGVDLSALYVIDNNLAPVLSESFGQCEFFLTTSGNTFFQNLWQQAAAQGISVFVSTGDNGSAGCDANQGTVPQPALNGLAISGIASTPFNVAVGGTDFNDFSNPLTFWNSTNDPTTQASAKGYIPETTWNNSCTNSLLDSDTADGFTTNPETNCNNPIVTSLILTVGGSGGVSSCTTSNGNTLSSCAGGYAKPVWQTGAGVPSDGKRDIPDVSLFASNGFVNNFYVICEGDITGGFCNLNNLAGFGGTSVSTPAFAGIMALADQQMGTTTGNANFRQGNPNYVLYKLAAAKPTAFHDIPSGSTIAMPCQSGSPNCTVNVAGHTFGILSGYATGTGYDLATGLGSVDANALVTNWNTVTFTASATTMTAPTPTSITHGQAVTTTITVAPVPPATGTPTGDVSLLTSNGQSVGRFTLVGGTVSATTNTIPGGTQTLIAHYEGDSNFGGSDSAASASITVTPEPSSTAITAPTFNPTNGVETSSNATSVVYGSAYLMRINITNAAKTACSPTPLGQSACPTGTVTLTDNSNPLDGGMFKLNSLGYTEDQAIELSAGSHNIQAQYGGDSSFNSSSSTDAISVTQASTSFTTFSVPATGTTADQTNITATISSQSFGAAPTGTVTFLSDGNPITGNIGSMGVSGSSTGTATYKINFSTIFSNAGTHTITANYLGDTNYTGSSSQAATIKIGLPAPNITISPSFQTVDPGTSVTLTALVDSRTAGPVITGTVTFIDSDRKLTIPGNVTLNPGTDASGNPTLSASLAYTPAGNQTIQANYSGDSNYPAASSDVAILSVNGTDFSVVAPTTLNVVRGTASTAPISVFAQNGFTSPITFSCTGLPAEAVCSFFPASIAGGGSTQMTVTAFAPHSRGTIHASMHHWLGLAMSGVFGFLLIGVPQKRKWSRFLSLIFVALVITISASCGGGSSGGGGGGGVTPSDPGTPTGTYTATVTATSGTLTHTASFQLIVQ